MKENFYVYILASKKEGVLYIGVTSNLQKRCYQHKEGLVEGFSKKYNVKKLVYYEVYNDAETAITREKNMKAWKREWKIELFKESNPDWDDLYQGLTG